MPGTAPYPGSRPSGTYRGEQFGLPRSGAGSVAGFGRRLVAVTVDWFLALFIAGLFTGEDPFSGGSNLGALAGGAYEYHGHATSDAFVSAYKSAKDHGEFRLTRYTR